MPPVGMSSNDVALNERDHDRTGIIKVDADPVDSRITDNVPSDDVPRRGFVGVKADSVIAARTATFHSMTLRDPPTQEIPISPMALVRYLVRSRSAYSGMTPCMSSCDPNRSRCTDCASGSASSWSRGLAALGQAAGVLAPLRAAPHQ